jgi:hypothetical protein
MWRQSLYSQTNGRELFRDLRIYLLFMTDLLKWMKSDNDHDHYNYEYSLRKASMIMIITYFL